MCSKSVVGVSAYCVTHCTGGLHNHVKVLSVGMKTYEIPPDYSGNLHFTNQASLVPVPPTHLLTVNLSVY